MTALYLASNCLALALCIWAAIHSVTHDPDLTPGERAWTCMAAVLFPPLFALSIFAARSDHPLLHYSVVALPLLTLAATWSSLETATAHGKRTKTAALAVLAFNATLLGIYTIRALQNIVGWDLGTFGTAITGGHLQLYPSFGSLGAAAVPFWIHVPFILPLSRRYHWEHKLAVAASALISAVLLLVLALSMPEAYARAEGYREPAEPLGALRKTLRVGVRIPWADRIESKATLHSWRASYLGLEADLVAFEIGPEVFGDPELFSQVSLEIDYAKGRGRRVVAIVRPDHRLLAEPAVDAPLLASGIAQTQQLVAERLEPDVLVLFSGPFGQLRDYCVRPGTIDQWLLSIEQSANGVRAVRPRQMLAVIVESRAIHAEKLFERLCEPSSPVSIVGLTMSADGLHRGEIASALLDTKRWIGKAGRKQIWLLGIRSAPQTTGGELGCWQVLSTALAFADLDTEIRAVGIDSLIDRTGSYGLVAPTGRPRLAYRELRSLLRRTKSASQPAHPR